MNNKKSVMVAVLNQGKIATGLTECLLAMKDSPYYDVEIEFPDDAPISNNRNKIVQRFLAKDYDYLLMIDSDIVPPPSVINMADFQKDIIAATAFIYQGVIMPVAWNRMPDGMYKPIDISEYDGIVEVDAIGTGCVMLSRKVLEDVKAPFLNEYDPDGIKLFGLDIAFCQKAKEKGYKVFTSIDYVCSHYKTVDLKTFYAIFHNSIEEIKRLNLEIERLKLKNNENN
jgi:GT2 family glycosyltransferase